MKGVCEYRRPNHTSANAIAKASIPTASAPAMTMLRLPTGTPGPSGVATLARSRVERNSPASVGGLVRYAGAPLRLLENADSRPRRRAGVRSHNAVLSRVVVVLIVAGLFASPFDSAFVR